MILRLLPLAAIVTPGTITVNSTVQTPEYAGLVPQLEYNFEQFAIIGGEDPTYEGPNAALSRLAISSAMQGDILPISAP